MIASVFTGILPPDRFERVTLALGGLIDGLWLRRATGEHLPPDQAIALVLTVASALLSRAEHLTLHQSDKI